jgi:hypothetical protein
VLLAGAALAVAVALLLSTAALGGKIRHPEIDLVGAGPPRAGS